MAILYPVIYLLFGYMIGKTELNATKPASFILTKCIIPLVIIWNISIYFEQMALIIVSTIIVMLILFLISYKFTGSATNSLCLCYLNIGWLGLPIATSLFGDEAARFMLATYIGSSIFGNSIGANYLSGSSISLKRIMTSPPVIALILGLFLIPFNEEIAKYGQDVYQLSKFIMSLFGMLVLGIWLANININKHHIIGNTKTYLSRVGICIFTIIITSHLAQFIGWDFLNQYMHILILIFLLPPAANIIVLESYYRGSGDSAIRISCETILSIGLIAIYAEIIKNITMPTFG